MFKLDTFKVGLVDNITNQIGMVVELNNFDVDTYLYDAVNYHNVNSIELRMKLKNFQVDSTKRNNTTKEIEKIEFVKVRKDEEAKEGVPLIDLSLNVGNKVHHATKLLKPEEIDDTSLTLSLDMQPIELIF